MEKFADSLNVPSRSRITYCSNGNLFAYECASIVYRHTVYTTQMCCITFICIELHRSTIRIRIIVKHQESLFVCYYSPRVFSPVCWIESEKRCGGVWISTSAHYSCMKWWNGCESFNNLWRLVFVCRVGRFSVENLACGVHNLPVEVPLLKLCIYVVSKYCKPSKIYESVLVCTKILI